ncbi:D-alanyl-lipoteichoic acid biosynthesis protein DltD [Staphylococcus sp. SQ8-PEA]|uniref:D-alanyl-lipoteichoic acid biosynthesis protein DltD n=1 Tax=Staphylococcus marylandisciuri TaxID=2981529 RepID=A0ABT2QST8_9STAP|nr:D-alanyl-lipoteichoic acid biosynthesis protein DltD [Staphylococcus marylandisciuri]MCU5747034.1 D-alanyl-lipoteichoic acid biosynthesis protein DltD [Staphylococcus marylandisciuri]
MKKYPAIIALVVSAIVFIGFLLTPAQWYKQHWTTSKLEKESVSLTDHVLKGTDIQSAMMRNKNFYPIYGSSELNKNDPFQPAMLLKKNNQNMFYVGKGGSTGLLQTLALGSQYSNLKGKKMTVLISPQWFSKTGMSESNYQGRVSKLQINEIFENEDIPMTVKKRLARRLLDFKDNKDNAFLKGYVKGDTSGHFVNPWQADSLQKIERIKAFKPVKRSPLSKRVAKQSRKNRALEPLEKKAIRYGKQHSKSNEYGIKDPYWKLLKKHKRYISRNHEFKLNSPEFKDLKILTELLDASGADVQYVVLPVNGKWYDHIHMPKDKRYRVYDKIDRIIKKKNPRASIYDMRSEDYTPYVMSDTVHIGWRGWVILSQHIQDHIDGTKKHHQEHKVQD